MQPSYRSEATCGGFVLTVRLHAGTSTVCLVPYYFLPTCQTGSTLQVALFGLVHRLNECN